MLIKMFLEHMKINRDLADKTIEKYETNLRLLQDGINVSLENATYSDLMSYVADLRDRGMQNTTINNKLVTIKAFYSLMVKIGRVDNNPAKALDLIKIKNKDENFKRTIKEEKINKAVKYLEDNSSTRNELMFKIFVKLGLRLSELTNIKIYDIVDNTLTITRKGGERQTLPLNDELVELINTYINNERGETDSEYLFITRQSPQISGRSVQRIVKKTLKRFVDDKSLCHTHQLRHFCFSRLVRKGVNLNVVKEIANHKSIEMTKRYLHNDMADIKNALSI